MNLLLDTNILVHVLRAKNVDQALDFIGISDTILYVSVVSEAEIRSLAIRNKWGSARRRLLDNFLERVNIVEITQLYVNAYVQIDSYSQGTNPNLAQYSFTSRNMGKNDLWIAALAFILTLELVTTDSDFDHLNKVFFPVRKINPAEFKKFA